MPGGRGNVATSQWSAEIKPIWMNAGGGCNNATNELYSSSTVSLDVSSLPSSSSVLLKQQFVLVVAGTATCDLNEHHWVRNEQMDVEITVHLSRGVQHIDLVVDSLELIWPMR